jgi:predicted nucleotide-binding protein (sugar kinase/HSP70/actin superfamily)
MKSYKDHTNWLRSNILPSTYCRKGNQDRIKLLILGHSYNVFDSFINMDIIKKLCEQGVDIVLAEDVSESDKRFYSGNLSKRIFWTHGRRIVGSAFYLIENKNIDGIIYLSAFGCGLDSVLINIVENKAHENNVPIMIMTFDEQTGEAGFNTRFEAFLDMMKWRSEIEDNFSSSR